MINSRIPQVAMSDFTKTLPLSCPMQKLLNKSTCNVSVENLPFDQLPKPYTTYLEYVWFVRNIWESWTRSQSYNGESSFTMYSWMVFVYYNTIQCLCARYLSRINVVRRSYNAELHKPKTCTGHDIIQMSIIFFTAGTKHQNLDIGQYVKLHA